jgi:hypothetical protein
MYLPGNLIGSGVTERDWTWAESLLGPQSFHEKSLTLPFWKIRTENIIKEKKDTLTSFAKSAKSNALPLCNDKRHKATKRINRNTMVWIQERCYHWAYIGHGFHRRRIDNELF